MKKLLFTCDQVFEALTRGPFPTGDENDEHVEHHLRACHDCRQLAEALRPAVELFHEVVAEDQALDLPEYQGSLPDPGPAVHRLSVVRLAKETKPTRAFARPFSHAEPTSRMRWLAATLLVIGLSLWALGVAADKHDNRLAASLNAWLHKADGSAASVPEGIPGAKNLLSLASLKLPPACMPLSHRPLSHEHAAELALSLLDGSLDKLRCCTECHHAGQAQSAVRPVQPLAQVALKNCQSCHRG